MKNEKTLNLVKSALFIALICVATMVIRIPSPTQGYVNLGDCFVLLAGWILGPVYGALSAGIGSMMSDLLAGYAYYAPATFLFKGLSALIASLLFRRLKERTVAPHPEGQAGAGASVSHGEKDGSAVPASRGKKESSVALVISGIAGEIIVVAGYFSFACLILGRGLAAAAGIPGNLLQATLGIVCGTLLYGLLKRTGIFQK